MAKIYCKSSYLLRRDTAANWSAKNPILREGEEGYETDTGRRKVGNGTTEWNNLKYDSGIVDQTYTPTSENAQSGKAVAEAVTAEQNRADNTFANALKGSKSGSAILIDDVSPVSHEMSVKISSDTVTDLTAVKVSRYGKNFIDIDSIANDIVKKNPTTCEITDFDGKRCLKIGTTSTIKYTIQTLIPLYGLQLKVYSMGYSAGFMGYTKNDTGTSVIYITVSAENEWVNIKRYYPAVSQYYTEIRFYKTDVTKPIYIDLDSVMLEASHTATEYEPYKGSEYTPTADGTVNGVTSLYPSTNLTANTDGVLINCEYNRDINKAFAALEAAIISSGGNV